MGFLGGVVGGLVGGCGVVFFFLFVCVCLCFGWWFVVCGGFVWGFCWWAGLVV